jgi:HPt (histidine-containing phosphotransfer) domain-containing protein
MLTEDEPPARPEPIWIAMPDGLEDLVPGYLASRRKEASEMIALLAGSEYARLAVLGHNLKGTGTGYGFPDLTRMGAALEQAAKRADQASLKAQIVDLNRYLDRVQLVSK